NYTMSNCFESDSFPGRPRILFVGLPENSHTHSWIDLLREVPFNVRLFAEPRGAPPEDWNIPTYITAYDSRHRKTCTRTSLYSTFVIARLTKRELARLVLGVNSEAALRERWLAKTIRRWRPDII